MDGLSDRIYILTYTARLKPRYEVLYKAPSGETEREP